MDLNNMNILLLETATAVCSVALAKDDQIVREIHSNEPNAHSSKLSVFVRDIFIGTGLALKDLDAVCVASGPGSYTGLRIGVSSAKGLCYALNKPLLSVPTLMGMASGYYMQHSDFDGFVCPMIDARRMECYTAIYNKALETVKPVAADVIQAGCYDTWLNQKPIMFVGDGAEKTREVLAGCTNARYDKGYVISATGLLPLAIKKLAAGEIEDVAYFEPFYLKDFVAKKSVVHGLR